MTTKPPNALPVNPLQIFARSYNVFFQVTLSAFFFSTAVSHGLHLKFCLSRTWWGITLLAESTHLGHGENFCKNYPLHPLKIYSRNWYYFCTLRQGWVFLKRQCVYSGVRYTRYFIEFVGVETKQIISVHSNVILTVTQQTCGQREGKRRVLAFYFSVQIWNMFLMSKCRGESDLGLCMTLVLAKRMSLRSTDFRQILRPNTRLKIEIWYCAALFSVQVLKSCTDLDLTPLYISIRNI